MSKFFGGLFGNKSVKNKPFVYLVPPLSRNEAAMSDLIWCITTGRALPNETKDALKEISPEQAKFPEPYNRILKMWQSGGEYNDQELEVLYSILLTRKLKETRSKNKDFEPFIPGHQDAYDKIGWE